MFKQIFGAIVVLSVLYVSGCASVGIDKDVYYNKLSHVELGMTKPEFKQIFPNSIPRGAKKYPNGTVTVLQVSYAYYSFFPTGNRNRNEWTGMEGQAQWFYFYNGRLVQYGYPGDWPEEADLVVEVH